MTAGEKAISAWFKSKKWKQFAFQKEMQAAYLSGFSGLLNAPTGSGKTFALFLPIVADYINRYPATYKEKRNNGLMMLWITPLRALTNDIRKAMQTVVDDLEIPWSIGSRTGDTSAKEKQALKRRQPEVLLTTPESLHLMLSQKDYPKLFENLQAVIADEWHELLGTKRGVQLELGLSRLKGIKKGSASNLRIWGISATIGNLEQGADVLLGHVADRSAIRLVRADLDKKIEIQSIIPDDIEQFSWAGHLGIKLLPKVMDIVAKSKTTLIFTNTRSQSEIWYHAILDRYPEYAGIMAMHHGSLDNELRSWVEAALHNEMLKLVVCTSSLDLGVDFRPVDSVVQIGSPKGVARFMQRAGRSGHHPGATSKAWFVPTHSLELLEGAAIKGAIEHRIFESRDPIVLAMDVLMQYLVTLAVSDGFRADQIFHELKDTYAYAELRESEYAQILNFITLGGKTLSQYDEYLKVEIEEGLYKVKSKRVAMRHRLTMGTIVSDVSMRIKFLSGGYLGSIEEDFVARMKVGDNFWFAGRSLELVKIKDMTAFVKKSPKSNGRIPSWMGGRIPLSSQLSAMFRSKLDDVAHHIETDIEIKTLRPLFDMQAKLSHLPTSGEFLIEGFNSHDGYHLFFYPFEGRLVHEGMASLFAYRIAKVRKASFSIAMNDYGFELLSADPIPLEEAIAADLFSSENLLDDIQNSLNANEMARRRFRDIAHIAGLVFTGFPGKTMKNRHLQASTSLLFDVFNEYEPDNVLVRQAYNEALQFQLEEFRLREALSRLQKLKVIITESKKPTPFAFPIMVDRLREKLTTETLEERVAKMSLRYSKGK
ncbi:ATP-dependent Lhr-like helicase [Arcticibacter pallidicorallinus]|uniref:ATP-dependent Lhr-like helicase n=1 Tax=Arcticibacter pallidicorallinus TaxID=1259464 RepID=A0A2T0U7J4_9SPHI|nr:ligase-associated DNA damage response DEXH box helicase [Arcticibacter pallidicorallinus]PRY53879.1 ATP-dependent Lhr-like helicase [Arcticibacter pallidicorallinus]